MTDERVFPGDVAELLCVLHQSASKLLADQDGELYPVASALASDGGMPLLAAHTGEEQPDPGELLDMLVGALHEQAASGEIRAAAVCANVRRKPSPATQDAPDRLIVR